MCMCRDSDASAVLIVIWKREDEQHFQHCEQHEQHCEQREQHCEQREEIKRTNQAALAGGLRTRRWGLISWISLLIFHKGSQWQKDFMVPFGVLWYLLPLLGVAHNSDWCCHLWIFRRVKKRRINSQSLEDTQVGYILQKYTLDNYTLKNTLWLQKAFSSKTTVAQKCQGAMEIHKYHFAKIHLR